MSAIEKLSEEEAYLWAILSDQTGVDQAEFLWVDEDKPDRCFRLWDFQWPFLQNTEKYQVDLLARGLGKALALDTPIPTPDGWKDMGGLQVGDTVFDENGAPTKVTQAWGVRYDRPCYEVEFSDGSVIVADGEHQWLTWDKSARVAATRGANEGVQGRIAKYDRIVAARELGKTWQEIADVEGYSDKTGPAATIKRGDPRKYLMVPQVRTTEEIASSLRTNSGEVNHSIPLAGALEIPERALPVDPYYLGVWLGDGTHRNPGITLPDDPVLSELQARGFTVRKTVGEHSWSVQQGEVGDLSRALKGLGVLWPQPRHIPADYLRASEPQRRDVLAGIFDTDGHITAESYAEITQKSERLTWDIYELLVSLGEKPTVQSKRGTIGGRDVGEYFRITWRPQQNPARLPRKAERWTPVGRQATRSGHRHIVAVRPVESVPVRCIEVDSPSHLFLAGKGMIPTHNSVSITMAALAFPFDNPAQDFLITAPQMKHLKLITDTIMQVKTYSRIYDEMLPKGRQGGVVHAPSFQMNFVNHAHIITRLPGVDGKGLKGPHPIRIEMDECFPAGTLILTDRGQVPIEAVEVGDRVLTHEGRWRAVERTWDRGVQPAVRLKGQGHPGLVSTADHLYWGSSDGASGEWVPAQEMVGKKWATPAQARGLTPPMGIIPRTPTGASVDIDPSTNDFAWALGLYLAEGSLSSSYGKGGRTNRIYWSVNDQVTGEVIQRLTRLGVTPRAMPTNGACDNVLVTHQHYAQWLEKHVGRGARIKQVPAWVYSMPEEYRRQVLMGAIYGDGWLDNNPGFTGKRWKVATAGKPMAISLRILASSLDYDTCLYWNPPPVQKSSISGREINSGGWYQLVIAEVGRGVRDSNHIWSAVKSVEPAEPARMYDLQVADDNSFVADGVVVHNSQDITEAAYMEIIETIKINAENARWRVHGVSNGTRDMHYKLTHGQGTGLPFYVHKYMAMHRPDWNDEERENKISIYGGTEDHPDYVRNVYGEPSDLGNPIFVTARLMAIASIAQTPADEEYNTQLYTRMNISQELIDSHGDFLPLMDWNYAHLDEKYTSFWGGMDVGFTNDPSEILIFGSEKGFDRLLLRIHLERVTAPYQEQIIREVFKFYGARLKRFGMDKTGNGLPLWHYLKDHKGVADRIAGYNFGSKVAAELEDRELAWDEKVEDLAIMKWAKDHATDLLRKAVDTKTIRLPFDNDLLTEWQGQSVTTVRVATSQDGTIRQYSGGECVPGDAEVLTAAGWVPFERYVKNIVPIAQWDDGRLEMVMPTAIVEKPYSGDLVTHSNEHLFYSAVTPGHLLPYVRRGKLQFKPAGEATYTKNYVWPRGGVLDGPGVGRSKDEIALQLAVSADGCIQKGKGRRWITFGFAKQRKVERLEGILDRLGIYYRKTQANEGALTYIRFYLVAKSATPGLTWLTKELPAAWLTTASLDEREFILDEIAHWDGYRGDGKKRTVFCAADYAEAVWAQTMSHTAGRMATITKQPGQYQVMLRDATTGTHWSSLQRKDVPHEGLVYCAEVPSGKFLVRQNGCISMIHNCHTLDAGRMYILAKGLMGIEAMLEKPKHSEPVLDMFY